MVTLVAALVVIAVCHLLFRAVRCRNLREASEAIAAFPAAGSPDRAVGDSARQANIWFEAKHENYFWWVIQVLATVVALAFTLPLAG